MSVVLLVLGSIVSPILTIRAARIPLLGYLLGPIAAFFSSFLIAGTASAITSFYFLGVSEATINAGEGMFVWVFFLFVIPVLIIHAILVLGTVR